MINKECPAQAQEGKMTPWRSKGICAVAGLAPVFLQRRVMNIGAILEQDALMLFVRCRADFYKINSSSVAELGRVMLGHTPGTS